MKIIFVLHSHKAGGAERHLYQLMSGLAANGIECLYAGPLDSWLGTQLQMAGFRCEHIPYHGIYDIVSLFCLARLIRRENADLVHGHLTRGALYAGWAAKLAKVPSIATAHSTNAGKHFGRAARIIAVSDAVANFLRQCGYARSKLCVVHHGVPNYALKMGQDLNVNTYLQIDNNDAPIISMVARFEKAKGHDIAFEALSRIKHLEWQLLLAGATDTTWAKEMMTLAEILGIADRCHFVGHVENVAAIYNMTDILIAPSRREALSLTLLEASSFGLPIVATDVGGIGEAVENKETGILVDSENPIALASGIETLLSDNEMRSDMGNKARKRYDSLFSLAIMIDKTTSVYQSVLAEA